MAGMVVMKGFRLFKYDDERALNYDKPPPSYKTALDNERRMSQLSQAQRKRSSCPQITPQLAIQLNKNLPSMIPEISVQEAKEEESRRSSIANHHNNNLTVTTLDNQYTITSLGKVSILEGNNVVDH